MEIVVDEALKAYIEPLSPDEREALERSVLQEGCRDALVLWGNVLVDGHNRYEICRLHGLPFQTIQHPRLRSVEDVHLWMIDQHLGRRSVSDFQRGVLALRKRELLAARSTAGSAAVPTAAETADAADASTAAVPNPPVADPLATREALAKAARLSSNQVVLIEKIQKQAAPEVVAAVRAGSLSISAAAAVASLPLEEQAAAAATGPAELKQAARRVREAKRKAPPQADAPVDANTAAPVVPGSPDSDDVSALRAQVASLTAENHALRAQLAVLQSQVPSPA